MIRRDGPTWNSIARSRRREAQRGARSLLRAVDVVRGNDANGQVGATSPTRIRQATPLCGHREGNARTVPARTGIVVKRGHRVEKNPAESDDRPPAAVRLSPQPPRHIGEGGAADARVDEGPGPRNAPRINCLVVIADLLRICAPRQHPTQQRWPPTLAKTERAKSALDMVRAADTVRTHWP